ncbi:unnamed protein product [Lactuca virosa]|uniref:Uncharacterized protein n=1 Tax=Lactuca virosa TaxID=75947 RepID=A0AAU9P8I9_9ASTR|nr:unnamed protein product [Lactuca virosa]
MKIQKILIQVFDKSDLILTGCSPVKPLPFHLSSRNTFLLNHILPLCPPDPFMRVEPKHEELNRFIKMRFIGLMFTGFFCIS